MLFFSLAKLSILVCQPIELYSNGPKQLSTDRIWIQSRQAVGGKDVQRTVFFCVRH